MEPGDTSPALKRRILISNLLMVLIPVIATGMVGFACAFAIWQSLSLGRGFDDSADLREATLAASALADRALASSGHDRADRLDELDRLLDKTGLALDITNTQTGETVHTHGAHEAADASLAASVSGLGDVTVQHDGRAYASVSLDEDDPYTLGFYANIHESASYPQLKAAIIGACALVLVVVLASSALTSRIVSRFLVRRLEDEIRRSGRELAASNAELTRSGTQLAEANEQLRRRDAARRQLLADISHDLRSPLTSIRGYAEGLLDGVAATPERQRHYLEVIRDKTEQVSGLVENLLAFSKLELDDYPVKLEDTSLAPFVRECAQGFLALHEDELELEFALGDAWACVDRELLGRAINNVLDNSVKYRSGGRAHVRLSLRALDEGAAKAGAAEPSSASRGAILELADDGRGVSAEDAEHLFDPFFRTDTARERPQDGSGMGLAFVRRALELMGGTATAAPRTPHGLTVTFELPVQEAGAGTHTTP